MNTRRFSPSVFRGEYSKKLYFRLAIVLPHEKYSILVTKNKNERIISGEVFWFVHPSRLLDHFKEGSSRRLGTFLINLEI